MSACESSNCLHCRSVGCVENVMWCCGLVPDPDDEDSLFRCPNCRHCAALGRRLTDLPLTGCDPCPHPTCSHWSPEFQK